MSAGQVHVTGILVQMTMNEVTNNVKNVMRQSACFVINQIKVDGYAALFNCTPVDRASDSMMAPTSSFSF